MSDPVEPQLRDNLEARLHVLMTDESSDFEHYLSLARSLYQNRRFVDGEALTARATEMFPNVKELWNIRGVMLRVLRRPDEALVALDRAIQIDPNYDGAVINRGNVLMDLGDAEAALALFTHRLEPDPRGAESLSFMGRALLALGRPAEAIARFREATRLKPDAHLIWLEYANALKSCGEHADAQLAFIDGIAANPASTLLIAGFTDLLCETGQEDRAEPILAEAVYRHPDVAQLHLRLGKLHRAKLPSIAMAHLRKAFELEPAGRDILYTLVQFLDRALPNDEAVLIDQLYHAAVSTARGGSITVMNSALLQNVYERVCAFADIDDLESERNRSGADRMVTPVTLLSQIGRATTPERRWNLMDQHRVWGRGLESVASRTPIQSHGHLRREGKVRVGVLSADLRAHVVGFFAFPLFEHIDRERFEVFAYSFNPNPPDAIQDRIASHVDGFRQWPDIKAHDAAQKIADDDLDFLVEIGGHTDLNKPEVLAYRPAPIQASWLGYPHSIGLSTVDYFICDPRNQPTRADLLIEEPLLMPASWIAISPALISRYPPPTVTLASDLKGYVTYGTANNPKKYTHQTLAAWARIVAATPGSHFAFLRPEAGSAVFRRNVARIFAEHGVSPDRLDWMAVRGTHMPLYGEIDITLDTFPLTGGTTTVDALMMGVPVVSLVGEAFHERISHSILASAGLSDLSAFTPDAFQTVALRLAADRDRRLDLRRNLRATLLASPLGQTETFARDFYEMIHRTVMQARQAKAASQTGG